MNDFQTKFQKELEQIESLGQRRSLSSPAGIDFSSNDYLGLAKDPRIIDAFKSALDEYGVGSTGSRLLRGERDLFREAEERFAEWKGTEASLYFATGYQANVGLMATLT